MTDEQLEQLAEKAKIMGNNNLAIVLYGFLGAKKAGLDGDYAAHTQEWVTRRLEELEQLRNRRNN